MLFENYKENLVYSSQASISFPKKSKSGKLGYGNMIFLLCPNRNKAIEALSDPKLDLDSSNIRRYITDIIYREKIGASNVVSLERSQTDKTFVDIDKSFPLKYLPYSTRLPILNKGYSVVNDLSRWMEIFFARSEKLPIKKKCSEFFRILSSKLNQSEYNNYNKILLIDLTAWETSVKNCVVMNNQLLNNPLSMILYVAKRFPELLEQLPKDMKVMIVNRAASQLYLVKMDFINKENYPKIKSRLSKMNSVIFSIEDDENPDESKVDEEINTVLINQFKDEIKNQMRSNLLGGKSDTDSSDISNDVADIFDEFEKELREVDVDNPPPLEEDPNEEKQTRITVEDELEFQTNNEINRVVDEYFDDVLDVSEIEDLDTEMIVSDLTAELANTKYRTSFIPERSEKELAKIERLTADQQKIINVNTIDDVKRKSISTSTIGGYVETTNPNIQTSKFVNFDKEYAEKCMEKNIDDSIAILSKASDKIFITEKTKVDSSTAMDLKETWTYKLVDEKGNRMQISIDVPVIIDGSYVYLNGAKKNIRHQFILKPIVKTSPDTVQIVTEYNKVFIYRKGVVNQNTNRINTYLEKNVSKFKVRTGNCSMLNSEHEVPLDFNIMSKFVVEFTIGDITYNLNINTLLEKYKSMTGKELSYDKNRVLPIGINKKTKEAIFMNLDDSYADIIYEKFSDDDKVEISKIKRKPRYVTAEAKIMGRFLPLILFMYFCEGFATTMKKANIKYEFIPDNKSKKKYDTMKYDFVELNNGFIAWDKSVFRNELLMNGLKKCDLSDFDYEDLESKDTIISLILPFFPGNSKIYHALDNFRDFLLGEKTKEILTDMGYPTDLTSLLVIAAGMLSNTDYLIENNLNNMRIRSNEVIADLVYRAVTTAYEAYRETAYKDKPTRLFIKKDAIIDALLTESNLIEEVSVVNPVLELEKQRSVTFKGIRGIQLDRAMTVPRRSYDKSMLGTVGITTSAENDIGRLAG